MNDLERLRYEALARELLVLRAKACGTRVGMGAFALFATWHLGWMTVAVGGSGILTSFLFQGLVTLVLFAMHRARFHEALAARAAARINQLLSSVVLEEPALSERWLQTSGLPKTAEFEAKRGAWLGAWLGGTFAAIWIVCVFVGCTEAFRVLRNDGGKLVIWLFAFTVWTTANLGFFWLHLTRPAPMPPATPDTSAA